MCSRLERFQNLPVFMKPVLGPFTPKDFCSIACGVEGRKGLEQTFHQCVFFFFFLNEVSLL